jgi:hypothetical protein
MITRLFDVYVGRLPFFNHSMKTEHPLLLVVLVERYQRDIFHRRLHFKNVLGSKSAPRRPRQERVVASDFRTQIDNFELPHFKGRFVETQSIVGK